MEYLNDKYYKRAKKTLFLSEVLRECKTFDAFKKYVSKIENQLEINQLNLETAKKNIPIAKNNIQILEGNILTAKEELEREDVMYNKRKQLPIRERIDEFNYLIQDMNDAIEKAKADIVEIPEIIENLKEWINDYLLLVEPQMKVERMKELNKGKQFEYIY